MVAHAYYCRSYAYANSLSGGCASSACQNSHLNTFHSSLFFLSSVLSWLVCSGAHSIPRDFTRVCQRSRAWVLSCSVWMVVSSLPDLDVAGVWSGQFHGGRLPRIVPPFPVLLCASRPSIADKLFGDSIRHICLYRMVDPRSLVITQVCVCADHTCPTYPPAPPTICRDAACSGGRPDNISFLYHPTGTPRFLYAFPEPSQPQKRL